MAYQVSKPVKVPAKGRRPTQLMNSAPTKKYHNRLSPTSELSRSLTAAQKISGRHPLNRGRL